MSVKTRRYRIVIKEGRKEEETGVQVRRERRGEIRERRQRIKGTEEYRLNGVEELIAKERGNEKKRQR